jgi:hypothetical protein
LQIQEEKDIAHRCFVVGNFPAPRPMRCHTTAEQPHCREESASTVDGTGAGEDWSEVHHVVMHHCGWLAQEIHRVLKNQAWLVPPFAEV